MAGPISRLWKMLLEGVHGHCGRSIRFGRLRADLPYDPVPVPFIQFVAGPLQRNEPCTGDRLRQARTMSKGQDRIPCAMADKERSVNFTAAPGLTPNTRPQDRKTAWRGKSV